MGRDPWSWETGMGWDLWEVEEKQRFGWPASYVSLGGWLRRSARGRDRPIGSAGAPAPNTSLIIIPKNVSFYKFSIEN